MPTIRTNQLSTMMAITTMLLLMSIAFFLSYSPRIQASPEHQSDPHYSHKVIEKEGKRTHQITMTAMENEIEIDNAGKIKYAAMTFNGTMPGPTVRVTEGDIVEFT